MGGGGGGGICIRNGIREVYLLLLCRCVGRILRNIVSKVENSVSSIYTKLRSASHFRRRPALYKHKRYFRLKCPSQNKGYTNASHYLLIQLLLSAK